MSHNIKLSGVRIEDLDTLESALQAVYPGARLIRNQKTFRTYAGQPNKCDHCIALPTGPHDIGLKATADGSFELVFDPYRMDRGLAASHEDVRAAVALMEIASPDTYARMLSGQATVGLLLQEYAIQTAEFSAARMGHMTTRVPQDNGMVALEVTGM